MPEQTMWIIGVLPLIQHTLWNDWRQEHLKQYYLTSKKPFRRKLISVKIYAKFSCLAYVKDFLIDILYSNIMPGSQTVRLFLFWKCNRFYMPCCQT